MRPGRRATGYGAFIDNEGETFKPTCDVRFGDFQSTFAMRAAGLTVKLDSLRLGEPVERILALQLLRYPEAAEAAQELHRPNLICDALHRVVVDFNRFYTQCPVVDPEAPRTSEARLALVEATACVIRHGLKTLGICPLGRM